MIHETILRKIFSQIPGTTDEEVEMAVDSTIHANEITFRDAIKNMATKDDIKNMATKDDVKEATKNMATKAEVREIKAEIRQAKMETDTCIAKLEAKLAWRLLGFATAIILINLAGTGLMLRFLLPS